MIILTLRTDKPEAELGLYEDQKQLAHITWQAHRELSTTLHKKIDEILNKSSISLKDVQGIVVFQGPGSFTGLRIGISVANALAYSLNAPIVAKAGLNWQPNGIKSLRAGENHQLVRPDYGDDAKTTKPRK